MLRRASRKRYFDLVLLQIRDEAIPQTPRSGGQQGEDQEAQQAKDDQDNQKEESGMKQERWLSRDKDGWYGTHWEEPEIDSAGNYDSDKPADIYPPEEFHRNIEGARLCKGRKRKIRRILIELED